MPLIAVWNVWQLIVDLADWPQNASQLFDNFGQTHFVLGSVCSNCQTKQNQTLTLILPTRISSPATQTMIAVLCLKLSTNFPLARLHKLPSKVHLQRSLNWLQSSSVSVTALHLGPMACPPYIVWKMCPSLQKRLLTIICRVLKNKSIPFPWQQAIIILLHKLGPSSSPVNFRPIALTNCDGIKALLLYCS